jgi:Flp pilus assembly protein protease CpaA
LVLLLRASPFLLALLVLGGVAGLALLRARREDVPVIFTAFGVTFNQITNRLPRRPGALPAAATADLPEDKA